MIFITDKYVGTENRHFESQRFSIEKCCKEHREEIDQGHWYVLNKRISNKLGRHMTRC